MSASKIQLRPLQVEDEPSFKKAVEVFQMETTPFEFAFHFDPTADFSAYVTKLNNWSQGRDLPDNFVPNTFFVGIVAGEVVGRLSLRHRLNDFLSQFGGHIGYGVVPAHRNRGYATAMLRQALDYCASFPIDPVLILCDDNNPASQKVIQRCGGTFERLITNPTQQVPMHRYWISTKPNARKTPL